MAVSKRLIWTDENGEKLEVEFGAEGKNVDINGKNLPSVISALQKASDKALKYMGLCDSSKSINDYNTDASFGIWQIGAGSAPSDMPIARVANENVLLVVSKAYGNGVYCKQELIYTVQNVILTRLYGTEWQPWSFGATTSTDTKGGNKFVTFSAGSKGELQESEYSPDMFVRSDSENDTGQFRDLTIAYPAAAPDDAVNKFTSGAYYDARAASASLWKPSYAADGQNAFVMNGDIDFSYPYWVKSNGKLQLFGEFNTVKYYSGANNEFKFRIVVIANIAADTVTRDIISLFNGNTTVQKRGAYGLRIVSKQGGNGNSIITSDYIAKTGLMAIAFEGSNNSGNMTLTVQPLNKDFTTSEPISSTTAALTSPAYIGSINNAKNFIVDATAVSTDIYSMYIETASGANALSAATVFGIVNSMCEMLHTKSDNAASVSYVQEKTADIAKRGRLENVDIRTIQDTGIYSVNAFNCTGLPADIEGHSGGVTLIVAYDIFDGTNSYINQYLIVNDQHGSSPACTKIYACELFGDSYDYKWTLAATTTATNLTQYSAAPQRVGTWIDGTPIWRVVIQQTITDEDRSDGLICPVLPIKDITNVVIINEYMRLIYSNDCAVDDIGISPLRGGSYDISKWVSNSNYDKISGWIEFVTPESNLKTT